MNKQYSTQSQNNLAFRDYMQMARINSKSKSPKSKKYSTSPNQSDNFETRKTQTYQYKLLEQRYRQLQNKYQQLLQIVKKRNIEDDKLKTQIKIYKKNHEKDIEQIQRLRCIIGLTKKRSVSIQVGDQQLDSSNFARASRLNKFDQSTQDQIKLKLSPENIISKQIPSSPIGNRFIKKIDQQIKWNNLFKDNQHKDYSKINKVKYNLNISDNIIKSPLMKYSRQIRQSFAENKKLSNSPYSKFRYIPGTNFK